VGVFDLYRGIFINWLYTSVFIYKESQNE